MSIKIISGIVIESPMKMSILYNFQYDFVSILRQTLIKISYDTLFLGWLLDIQNTKAY
jgi:hypothetical protein